MLLIYERGRRSTEMSFDLSACTELAATALRTACDIAHRASGGALITISHRNRHLPESTSARGAF